jgi:CRISPR-associated endonuclease/helicase Cas3
MAHLHAVTAVTGVDLQRALAQAPGLTGVDVVLWTGCISLADWLASADEAVSAGTAQLALLSSGQHSMYLSRRVDWFADNVAQTLGKAETPSDDFEAEFGFAPTRSIHSWAVRSSARGLSIIAAPTGEGKTEAGLALHQHAEPAESLFFALPTTATADAMFERVRAFYRGTAQYGALVHSRAILNNYYAPMATPRLLTTDVHNEGLTPSAWFRGRHKSILAPVAVGTCDQALAAVLKHRYNFMRLCGLANKHLILDEVHTYDPYMDYLLTKLLVWCGATGTRVTILTATLPARRTSAYLSAFALGAGWAHTSPAVYTYPYIAHITAGGASYTHVQAHRQYRLQLDYIYTADATDGLVRAARELAAQHPEAKIAVIANTVQRCISVAAQLDDRMPIILHARMTGQQRSRATQAIERAAGKDRQAGGVLVVGTQVLEASLDLDFDIMVTEFAPAASLLQRAGRLWRHNRPSRPVSSPTVHIVVPMTPGTGTDISNTPAWAGSEMAIPYEPLALTKTWDSLVQGQRRHIDIPDDVQALVDSADVSWEDVCRADKPTEAALARLASQQSAAGVRAIEPEDLLGDGMGNQPAVLAETTRGELADDEYATRYTELDSLTVLIYDPTASHPAAFPGSTQELQTARHPDDIIDILSYTIPTTGKTADALRQAGQPELLRHHPWPLLRDVCPIHIDRLPPGTSLHQTLGLITGATNAPQQSQL